MYPFPNRVRWFLFGRYSHLIRAFHDHPAEDLTLIRRIHSMRVWNSVRFVFSVLLSVGVVATLASALARQLPGQAESVLADIIAISTAATGALTLVYLFLTRLLGQIEIDILARLTLGEPK
ncbi:MAG TPA: hypothetical protein VM327_09580 [Candidatus Thermoplasmatota archaeon]|nr:hypothetical protein [Candidatus Thermoplasmatota archaeon]